MGFDINVTLTLHMCQNTGKPFYYDKDFKRVYGLPTFEIPSHLIQYLVGRGSYFHTYTERLEMEDLGYSVSSGTFLEYYPEWEDVVADKDEWVEEDHKNFKELLEWCEASGLDFRVTWSY